MDLPRSVDCPSRWPDSSHTVSTPDVDWFGGLGVVGAHRGGGRDDYRGVCLAPLSVESLSSTVAGGVGVGLRVTRDTPIVSGTTLGHVRGGPVD